MRQFNHILHIRYRKRTKIQIIKKNVVTYNKVNETYDDSTLTKQITQKIGHIPQCDSTQTTQILKIICGISVNETVP